MTAGAAADIEDLQGSIAADLAFNKITFAQGPLDITLFVVLACVILK